jgi:hypothetical protein
MPLLSTRGAASAQGFGFGASSSSATFYLVSIANSTAANTVTVTAYDIKSGLINAQTLSLPVRTVTNYTNFVFSDNGRYFMFFENSGTGVGPNNSYVHVYTASGGPGTLSLAGIYSETNEYSLSSGDISPNGTRICFQRNNVYGLRVLDISSSISSPTILATYGASQFSFGPRGGNYTPAGNIIAGAGSDEGHSFVGSGMTQYTQNWTGWNQSTRAWNYNGTRHLYYGSAVNTNYYPYVYSGTPTQTSLTQLNSSSSLVGQNSGNAVGVNPNEAVDGLPYFVGRQIISTGDNYPANGLMVVSNYTNGNIVYTSSFTSSGTYWPNGLIQQFNSSTSQNMLLDPTASFVDVSSNYAAIVKTTSFNNFWPVFGKQTLYTTI